MNKSLKWAAGCIAAGAAIVLFQYLYVTANPIPKVGDTYSHIGGADAWCTTDRMRILEIERWHALVEIRSKAHPGQTRRQVIRVQHLGTIYEADSTDCFASLGGPQ